MAASARRYLSQRGGPRVWRQLTSGPAFLPPALLGLSLSQTITYSCVTAAWPLTNTSLPSSAFQGSGLL